MTEKKRTHRVFIVRGSVGSEDNINILAGQLEDAFVKLNQEALTEGYVVVSCTVLNSHYDIGSTPCVQYTVIAQIVSRTDLERANRIESLKGIPGGRS